MLWDIISIVKVISPGFDKTIDEILKTSCKDKSSFSSTITNIALNPGRSWLKRDVEASLFILSIIEFELLNNIDVRSIFKQL